MSRCVAVAAGATSHHRIKQRTTCACVRDGSTERTEPTARRGAARAGAGEGRPRPPAAACRPRALHRARPPPPHTSPHAALLHLLLTPDYLQTFF
ncbi:hypothetical protein RR46_11199 [Papilio xuthus]|uniref:Uncharacterized protein n=1 Tax=Papilio xuthus TaxID=66420 RepID=A0A194PYH7_PAPXU|nr:hypothetical protein RR46_11199 [Papilio xuthus]